MKIIAPETEDSKNIENIIFAGRSRKVNFNGTQIDVNIAWGEDWKLLTKLLKEEKFDILHFHTIWNPFIAFQVAMLAKAPKIATYHDTPPDSLFRKLAALVVMPLMSRIIKSIFGIKHIIAVSSAPGVIHKKLIKNVHIIPNGINVNEFKPTNDSTYNGFNGV